ncbi:MAG: hypothetical protein JWM57_3798 [Phycisphaerales bacterium]|nr:hypothetical protein [Phycisphaerales bacterium]
MQTVRRATPCVVDIKTVSRRRRFAALAMAAATVVVLSGPVVSVTLAQVTPLPPASASGQPVLLAAVDTPPMDSSAALQTATGLYKAGKYEEALTALQAIKPESLSAADQAALTDATAKAQQATQLRRAARADFEMGQKALESGDSTTATNSFKNVANNPYADEGTKAKATEQMALADAGAKGAGTDWKAMYDDAVADFKAGNYTAAKPKFVALQQGGYKAPWFAKAPRDYLEQIDKNAAGPADADQARAAYLTGRDQYKKGDWIAARQNFTKAVSLNYKAGFFEDAPSKYLERMDKKEQSDAAVAAKQNMNSAPAAVVVAAVPETKGNGDLAVAPTTPAGKPQPESVSTPAATPDIATGDAGKLQANVQQLNAEQANKAAQAQSNVKSARSAEEAQRYGEALDLYTKAYDLDPSNEDAKAGRSRLVTLTGTSSVKEDIGTTQEREILARRQAITFSFNYGLNDAKNKTATGDFDGARTSIAQAEAASGSDPSLFRNEEIQSFKTQIADARTTLERAQIADREKKADDVRASSEKESALRDRQAIETRERAVASLIADSKRFNDQGRYEESLKVINQILILDPKNEYATNVRAILFDKASLQRQRRDREEFDKNLVLTLNEAASKSIPYADILTYPTDWPDLSARRDQTLRDERQTSAADEAVNALLDKSLPEIRFEAVSLSDVIDFLRDTTQANIFVNWKALEAAGIDRNAPVSTRLRNVKLSKVLKTVLESVGGGATVTLGYTVDEGVITISTTEDLAKNVETRTYDIRDLIIQIPDFTDFPEISLTANSGGSRTAGGGTGGGGGGGGGSSQNLFGGAGGGGGGGSQNQNTQTREELVDQITSLIRETIGVGTWKEDGGQLGSLRELGGQLIVTQTPEIHRQITSLLQKLREQRSIQVMVEARFLTVQKNFLEDVGIDFDFYMNFDGNPFTNAIPGGTIGTNVVANNTNGGTGADGSGLIVTGPIGGSSNVVTGATGATIDPLTGAAVAASSGRVRTGVAPIGVVQNSYSFTRASTLNTGVTGNLSDSFANPNLQTSINAFLDDFQASLLIRATQGNQNVTQLTAPRLTLFNGQTAYIQVLTTTNYVSDLTPVVGTGAVGFQTTVSPLNSGVVLPVTATVSADRKYVTMTIIPQLGQLISLQNFPVVASTTGGTTAIDTNGDGIPDSTSSGTTQTGFIQLPVQQTTIIKTTVSVPDGGTLLLGGTTVTGEIEREAGVPVLSKIPFLKRAFTNKSSAKDESVLLVLVKPTIIIQREIEQANFPLLSNRPG